MIGDVFVRYLKPVPARSMTRVRLFANFLARKIEGGIERASYLTPNNYGARLLTDIIKLANLSNLLTKDMPNDKRWDGIFTVLRDLEKPIDVRAGKHTTASLFVYSKTPCFELISPVRQNTPWWNMVDFSLPYSDPKWKSIKPLRIADMGTTDLRFQVHQGQLSYAHHGPTYALYTLDCVALVAKFVSFYLSQPLAGNLDQIILDFLHREVIIPCLLNDSISLWLRNIYKQQFLITSPLESHTSTIWDLVNIDTLGSDFTGASVDIVHLRDDLKRGSVTNQTVLSSLILSPDGTNFTSYFKNQFYTTIRPDEQPYVWIDCLNNLSWWEFILMISSFTPDFPDVLSLHRNAARDIRFWVMMKPWQNIRHSIPYQTMIRSRLEGMLTYLNSRG